MDLAGSSFLAPMEDLRSDVLLTDSLPPTQPILQEVKLKNQTLWFDGKKYFNSEGLECGVCEFCQAIGIKEGFYSTTKRFCTERCSKQYAASMHKRKREAVMKEVPKPKRNSIPKPRKTRPTTTDAEQIDASFRVEGKKSSDAGLLHKPSTNKPFISDTNRKGPPDRTPVDQDSPFSWTTYLAETSATLAPPSSFKHVSALLAAIEQFVGSVAGVLHSWDPLDRNNGPKKYWVASVVAVEGREAVLRYACMSDAAGVIRLSITSPHLQPINFCQSQGFALELPPDLALTTQNMLAVQSAYAMLKNEISHGHVFTTEIKQSFTRYTNKFVTGMKVEIPSQADYLCFHVATITAVVGDRLQLTVDGSNNEEDQDLWYHYLSPDLHPIGWAYSVGLSLVRPEGFSSKDSWDRYVSDAVNASVYPDYLFAEVEKVESDVCRFAVGLRLEALNPYSPDQLVVVTISSILEPDHLILTAEHLDKNFVVTKDSKTMFPAAFSQRYGVPLSAPEGYGEPFNWPKYVNIIQCYPCHSRLLQDVDQRSKRNPLSPGQKIEAVDLRQTSYICPATVMDTKGPLVLVHFDGWDSSYDLWCDFESVNIYPVHWCESNGHQIEPLGPYLPDLALSQFRSVPPQLIQSNSSDSPGKVKAVAPAPPAAAAATIMATAAVVLPKNRHRKSPQANNDRLKASIKTSSSPAILFRKTCNPGPFLVPEEVERLQDVVEGSIVAPPHNNCLRKALLSLINAASDPPSILDLIFSEFNSSKHAKVMKLENSILLEVVDPTGQRITRKVKAPAKTSLLVRYLLIVCELLGCCSGFMTSSESSMTCTCRGSANGPVRPMTVDQWGAVSSHSSFGSSSSPASEVSLASPQSSQRDCAQISPQRRAVSLCQLGLGSHEWMTKKHLFSWSRVDVAQLLSALNCADFVQEFDKQGIDGLALGLLTTDTLRELFRNEIGPFTKVSVALQSIKAVHNIS